MFGGVAGISGTGSVRERLVSVVASVLGVAGLAGIAFGVWEISEPAAYMVAGFELLFLSWRLS